MGVSDKDSLYGNSNREAYVYMNKNGLLYADVNEIQKNLNQNHILNEYSYSWFPTNPQMTQLLKLNRAKKMWGFIVVVQSLVALMYSIYRIWNFFVETFGLWELGLACWILSVNLLGLIAGLKKDRLSAKRYCKSVCWVILGIMIYVFLDGFEGQNDSKMIMKEEFRFEDIGYNIRNHGIVENVEGIETIYNENEEKYQENVIWYNENQPIYSENFNVSNDPLKKPTNLQSSNSRASSYISQPPPTTDLNNKASITYPSLDPIYLFTNIFTIFTLLTSYKFYCLCKDYESSLRLT